MSERTKAPAKAAQGPKLELDPKYIGRLTGTLLGISAVVALLLGAVNSVTAPIIETAGYVVEVTTSGYGGAMRMVVGVDAGGAVTGVAVADHGETSNVGTKVVESETVLGRFTGMSLADGEITVNTGTNRFDGVSGATVSSRGVTAGVNTALAAVAGLAE